MSTEMIIDFTEVQNMFRSTPETFLTEMRKFLYRERRSFVGNRQKPGSFRKSLYGQMHHYYGRPWKPYVGRCLYRHSVSRFLWNDANNGRKAEPA